MRAYRVQISRLPQKAKRRDDHATVFLTFCHLISIFANVGDLLQYSPFKPNSPFPIPFAQTFGEFSPNLHFSQVLYFCHFRRNHQEAAFAI